MTTEISIWDHAGAVADRLDELITQGEDFDLVLAQIPALFDSSPKAAYLGFRAVGMTKTQALEVIGFDREDYNRWRLETPELEEFEFKCIGPLQSRVSADIIRLGFMRNMAMFMFKDSVVIKKSLIDLEGMTSREFAYLRASRKFYSNHDLLALEKAIAPEKHRDNTLILNFGEAAFEVIDAEDGGNQIRLVEDSRVSARPDSASA
jgi:hypothetical protein